jgi:hypothetical protein
MRAERDKPTHTLFFAVRLWDKAGTAVPVDTIGMTLGIHMWDSVGSTLIRGVYSVLGGENPSNPLYQLVFPFTPVIITNLATAGSGVPIAIQ